MRSMYPHFSVYKACIHLRSPSFDFFLNNLHLFDISMYVFKWLIISSHKFGKVHIKTFDFGQKNTYIQ